MGRTREIGSIFNVNDENGNIILLEVCDEHIPKGGSPECEGCYFKHLHNEIISSGMFKIVHKGLDCWKFKLHSHAGECWSAFRTDGTHVVFKCKQNEQE